jgi:hypothetical protein
MVVLFFESWYYRVLQHLVWGWLRMHCLCSRTRKVEHVFCLFLCIVKEALNESIEHQTVKRSKTYLNSAGLNSWAEARHTMIKLVGSEKHTCACTCTGTYVYARTQSCMSLPKYKFLIFSFIYINLILSHDKLILKIYDQLVYAAKASLKSRANLHSTCLPSAVAIECQAYGQMLVWNVQQNQRPLLQKIDSTFLLFLQM